MADIAIGRPCPRCGTLTAISGTFSDATLHGTCASCGGMVSAAAFGGERQHAIRAAGIPATSKGEPAPAVPTIAAIPVAPVPVAQLAQSPPVAAVAPAPVANSKNRGGEKHEAA